MMIRLLILALMLFASILSTPRLVCGQERQLPALKGEDKTSSTTRPSLPPTSISDQQVKEGDVILVEANLVTVPASIMDRDGRYITNLRKEDFQIFEDGIQQEVAFFAPVEQPFTVLLLLDTSGSMTYRMEDLAYAANTFVHQLRNNDYLIAAAFDDWVEVLIQNTKVSDLRKPVKLMRHPSPPITMVFDAVDFGLKRMRKIRGRKAIVLFSDGIGSGIGASAHGNLRDAEELDALIYTVQFYTYRPGPSRYGDDREYLKRVERATNYMKNLAYKAGGRYFQIEEISDLEGTFGRVADELRRQCTLGYYPKKPLEAGQRREIKVSVNLPNVVVRARNSYTVDKDRAKRE